MFKSANVVMLPTNEKAIKGQIYGLDGLHISDGKYCGEITQHLYITSNEEIKEGDLFMQLDKRNIDPRFKPYQNCTKIDSYKFADRTGIIKTVETAIERFPFCNVGKLIASTNTLLELPQLSQQFIQNYIEEYNKGNIITDIMVEYRNIFDSIGINIIDECSIIPDNHFKLKTNPKDNTITIKKVKYSCSREEVEEIKLIIQRFKNHAEINGYPSKSFKDKVNKFIKENLLN